ncbi:hypothetical protein TPAR_08820 [Tolypocladium paradoxum]|uniref:Uncharacterized protein n=1 Tax=Tolypocladium paradoxum TaxID=94208 RepID=A0A2S4KL91_9HYPO|nr:hypothetical protein TPAR_08820 [Tolypocladium paradoxum]
MHEPGAQCYAGVIRRRRMEQSGFMLSATRRLGSEGGKTDVCACRRRLSSPTKYRVDVPGQHVLEERDTVHRQEDSAPCQVNQPTEPASPPPARPSEAAEARAKSSLAAPWPCRYFVPPLTRGASPSGAYRNPAISHLPVAFPPSPAFAEPGPADSTRRQKATCNLHLLLAPPPQLQRQPAIHDCASSRLATGLRRRNGGPCLCFCDGLFTRNSSSRDDDH